MTSSTWGWWRGVALESLLWLKNPKISMTASAVRIDGVRVSVAPSQQRAVSIAVSRISAAVLSNTNLPMMLPSGSSEVDHDRLRCLGSGISTTASALARHA